MKNDETASLTKSHLTAKNQELSTTSIAYEASSFKTSADKFDVVETSSYGVERRCYHDCLKSFVAKCVFCGGSANLTSTSIEEARKLMLSVN